MRRTRGDTDRLGTAGFRGCPAGHRLNFARHGAGDKDGPAHPVLKTSAPFRPSGSLDAGMASTTAEAIALTTAPIAAGAPSAGPSPRAPIAETAAIVLTAVAQPPDFSPSPSHVRKRTIADSHHRYVQNIAFWHLDSATLTDIDFGQEFWHASHLRLRPGFNRGSNQREPCLASIPRPANGREGPWRARRYRIKSQRCGSTPTWQRPSEGYVISDNRNRRRHRGGNHCD
jgi:hypothetical protein